MKFGAENEAGVFYATKGYYKGVEVTVTHHDGAMVWIEDYPVNKSPIEYGMWVPNESVSYSSTATAKSDGSANRSRSSKKSKHVKTTI